MPNTFTSVIPQLLAQGLLALRQQAIMPRLVNRGYESLAGDKMSSVDIPIPSSIAVQAVTPANTPPSTATVSPTKVTLTMDQWYEAPFYLTDKELLEVMSGVIPMQASEAIKALANQVDSDILALYKQVYGYAGTAGTTPFAADLSEWAAGRTVLTKQLAPSEDRRIVLGPDAVGKAVLLRAFQDANFGGGADALARGQFANKLGGTWFEDQNIPTHTKGAVGTVLVDQTSPVVAVGDTAVHFDGFTTKASVGDVFTVAGDTQTYTVVSCSDLSSTDADLVIAPGAKVAWANDAAVTFKASHVVNLAFHRDAFAFASRPFSGADPSGLGHFLSAVDPISGLSLRLEMSREHKRTRFSYDILYGVKCPRPELAVRIAG